MGGFTQAAGKELKNPVPVGVPKVSVYVFKVVEIGKGEAKCRMGILMEFLRAPEFAHGQFKKGAPVEEPRQRILVRRHPIPFEQPGKLLGPAVHLPAHLVECLGKISHERYGLRIVPLRDAFHLPCKVAQVGLRSLERSGYEAACLVPSAQVSLGQGLYVRADFGQITTKLAERIVFGQSGDGIRRPLGIHEDGRKNRCRFIRREGSCHESLGSRFDFKTACSVARTPTVNFFGFKRLARKALKKAGNKPFVIRTDDMAQIREPGTVQILRHGERELQLIHVGMFNVEDADPHLFKGGLGLSGEIAERCAFPNIPFAEFHPGEEPRFI